jgi:hypothetical protein
VTSTVGIESTGTSASIRRGAGQSDNGGERVEEPGDGIRHGPMGRHKKGRVDNWEDQRRGVRRGDAKLDGKTSRMWFNM